MLDKFLVLIALCFIGCSGNESDKKIVNKKPSTTTNEKINSFKTPSIFLGSTFGEFFQMLHKTGKYDEMLRYTSKTTKATYPKEQLLAFYTTFQFSYPLTLKAKREENNVIILLYQTTINATQKTIQIPVVIENDTCRIWLEKLNPEKPFVGI